MSRTDDEIRVTAARAARALHPSSGSRLALDGDVLLAIASGLGSVALAPAERSALASPGPGVIERTRLLSTDGYDAWLMVWGPGALAVAHDHGGSISAVHVVTGALTELVRGIDPVTGIEELSAHPLFLRAGDSTTLDALTSHELVNAAGALSVSVHVYSPPLGAEA